MLLYLFLLAGCFCHSFADVTKMTVQQNTLATLPCPHKNGDVSWSRLINGKKVILVSTRNGSETRSDKRFGSLADNSLVVNAKPSDSAMYFCNRSQIYLEVTTDPNMVVSRAGNVPVTPGNGGLAFGLGPAQDGAEAAGDADTEKQRPSDLWKVPAGVVGGAALVLLAVLALRFCSKNRAETNTSPDKTVCEVIYEEIEAGEERPRSESDVESPYYWTSIGETPSASAPPNDNVYSTVNKLKPKARSSEECVYYLAQHPTQTGSVTS